jgi:GT2 family glycosyltransferase
MPELENSTPPVIVFCSVNRPEMLHESVLCAVRQTVPCQIIVSVPDEKDVCPETRSLSSVVVLTGTRGLTAQRNHALNSIQGQPEAIVFLDDDVEVEDHYVERILETYRARPDVAIVNGANLAHGIYPAGSLDRDTAKQLIQKALASRDQPRLNAVPMNTAYGCRMSVRGSLLGKVFFDERLAIYGYLEDLDFALSCKRYGSIVENPQALGVHIEVSFGRTSEKRRGYSEVVNPFYICSKKTGAKLSRTILSTCYRTMRNAATALQSRDPKRFEGNLMGWLDTLKGQGRPEKILEI